jgi:glycosyltransferase involved in cell wall biosynthesis
MGEIKDINTLIKNSRALLLASKYEGLSNVICESFIMSRPVLVSNVCEHPRLIGDNERGFLFDHNDIESIYKSLFKMVFITEFDWKILSQNAYEFAVSNFSLNKMANSYISLLNYKN